MEHRSTAWRYRPLGVRRFGRDAEERAQAYYRDMLGFEIGWLYPGKEIGAVRAEAVGLRQFTVDDLDGNRFYFHHD